MCAIIGTKSISKFEVLYDANLPRGNFASGVISLKDIFNHQVIKKQGTLNFDEVQLDDTCDYYIGHVQAPTSAKREWSFNTSHPFQSTSWLVVHNGVLTNWKEIREQHPDWEDNPVDTAVIPHLLQHYTEQCEEPVEGHEIVKRVLNELEGTFAVAIIDTDCNSVYIARQGSVLHYNDHGEFSTICGEGFNIVPEGVILMLDTNSKWRVVDHFEVRSPFLFI